MLPIANLFRGIQQSKSLAGKIMGIKQVHSWTQRGTELMSLRVDSNDLQCGQQGNVMAPGSIAFQRLSESGASSDEEDQTVSPPIKAPLLPVGKRLAKISQKHKNSSLGPVKHTRKGLNTAAMKEVSKETKLTKAKDSLQRPVTRRGIANSSAYKNAVPAGQTTGIRERAYKPSGPDPPDWLTDQSGGVSPYLTISSFSAKLLEFSLLQSKELTTCSKSEPWIYHELLSLIILWGLETDNTAQTACVLVSAGDTCHEVASLLL